MPKVHPRDHKNNLHRRLQIYERFFRSIVSRGDIPSSWHDLVMKTVREIGQLDIDIMNEEGKES